MLGESKEDRMKFKGRNINEINSFASATAYELFLSDKAIAITVDYINNVPPIVVSCLSDVIWIESDALGKYVE